jgi:hypothetical protein
MRRIAVAVALSLLPSSAAAQTTFAFQPGACATAAEEFHVVGPVELPPPPVCRLDQGCVRVDWNIAPQQELTELLKNYRFNEKTPLRIHTSNVNLLRYKVTWTQKVEEQVKGFEQVTNLLEGVAPIFAAFSGGGLAVNSESPNDFDLWLRGLEIANLCLTDTVNRVTDIVIDRNGMENQHRLHEARIILEQALPVLLTRRTAYLSKGSAVDLEKYLKLAQRHDDFQKRAGEFIPLARRSVDGETSVMKTEQRNSIVVLTGQAVKSDGEIVGQSVTARYFVAWSRPVIYHVGYGYGRLKDLDFKQVRTLSGQDLFEATKVVDAAQAADVTTDPGEPEAIAFLTWELIRRGPNNRFGGGFTAGMGLQSPGDSLYVGGTLRIFSRLLITYGVVAARVTRGEGLVIDTTTSATSTRTLFAELKERTDRNPFWSVSFRVY